MSAPDDRQLIEIAGSIAQGSGVDWDRLWHQPADAATGGVLKSLKTLEQIASFHRSADMSVTYAPPDRPHLQPPPFRTWGHFTLLETIGEGSFGAVYRAQDGKLQSDVALKLIPLPAGGPATISRNLKEPRLLARVRHANVVTIHGADVIDGHVGIWMELIDGRTLTALLRAQGSFGAREAALIGADLCQALAAVHAAGLIHGDVKARNVMRESGGRTVLMDFGTGKDLRLQPVHQARGADLAGTPLYLAPEVFSGEPRSKLTDIYGLGVLLYHLVSTGYPVDGRTQGDVEDAHRRGARNRLRDARPDLPIDFVTVIERAISVDPAERFQTTGEFEAALARFLGRAPAPLPTPMPLPAPTRRWNWWAAAAAIVLLAAVVAARNLPRSPSPESNAVTAAPVSSVAEAAAASAYTINTTMYRGRGATETRLRSGDLVGPGDQIFARLQVSAPAYIYIVNEDDNGETFLLFPLPGLSTTNPVAAGTSMRIPQPGDGGVSWQVTSAGGREHFLIFASLERLQAFEEIFASLPTPKFGARPAPRKLSAASVGQLRGVGGLAQPSAKAGAGLAAMFTVPLSDREETAHGLWVRQLTLENPGAR